MPKHSTPAQYIILLIDLVTSQGHDPDRLLVGTSLAQTGIEGIGARVNEADFGQLVANAFELTQDPALGLKLGLKLNLSAHAVLGQAFMTCSTLEEVLDLFLKYYHLLSPALYLEQNRDRERYYLTTITTPHENPVEFAYELMYAGILNTLRGLLNAEQLSLRVEFPYSAPAHAAQYYEVFGDDVHFDAPRGRVSFDLHLLEAKLPSSNPALRALYESECQRLLADLEEEDSVVELTLRLLRKLEGQYPQMPVLARMLNFSPRTYRRRLEQEGHSYQALLDQVRAEHATHYLENTRLPQSTIAYIVGFNDASNFRRAYRKWTGRSPQDVRRAF